MPTRKPTRDSEISSDEHGEDLKMEKKILEDLDGLQELFIFEKETSSEEEEGNAQPQPYHTRSKGRAPSTLGYYANEYNPIHLYIHR